MKRIGLTLIFVLSVACTAERYSETDTYHAQFVELSRVDEIEAFLRSKGSDLGLRVFEKKRSEMMALTKGSPAFFTAFYFDDHPIYTVTNVGVADILVVTTNRPNQMDDIEYTNMTKSLLDSLGNIGFTFEKQ